MCGLSRLSMEGTTPFQLEAILDHNRKRASSILVVQVMQSYPINFPNCIGLVPNSAATTLRTVRALDIGSPFRNMGHTRLVTKSTSNPILSQCTSPRLSTSATFCFLSHIRMVSLGFYFTSRHEDDWLKAPALAAIDLSNPFTSSSLGIPFYSARLIVIVYRVPIKHVEDISILSLSGPVPSYSSSTPASTPMSYLSHTLPRDPVPQTFVVGDCLLSICLVLQASIGQTCGLPAITLYLAQL
jgi:hypothetical protein